MHGGNLKLIPALVYHSFYYFSPWECHTHHYAFCCIISRYPCPSLNFTAIPLQILIYQKQLQNVEYFNYLGSLINDAKFTRKIKSMIAMAKEAFNKKKV